MSADDAKAVEPFTIELTADELPQRVLDRFAEPPSANARFAVTVEPAASEAARLEDLRRDLEQGLADFQAGRSSTGEDVFKRLKARFSAG